MNLSAIRKDIYDHNYEWQKSRGERLIDIKYPYSSLKSIYYVETASLFLFLTQKFIKSPNFITFLYILFGVIGSFFISVSFNDVIFYIGIFMVFTKGTFDWADGVLARRLNKTSFIGHAFDVYGANICDGAFRISFVFYTFNKYPEYIFLFPICCFALLITRFNIFSDFLYLNNIKKNNLEIQKIYENKNFENEIKKNTKINKYLKIYKIYISFLDERARGIDFLLLILLLDKVFNLDVNIVLIFLSFLILLRSVIKYFATSYLAFKNYKDI